MTRFNYIITIHNKESVLERTLAAVDRHGGPDSVIYPVLDGCTDGSERIVSEFVRNTSKKVVVTKTPDVHEIRSINAALRQIDGGFTISLQDDVVLDEPDFEKKVEDLYRREGACLGLVSFCRAADLTLCPLYRRMLKTGFRPLLMECGLVKAKHDHCRKGTAVAYGTVVYKMVGIKSPICIPESALGRLGILDESLAPYLCDDHEYSIRCLKEGFRNALFPVHFISDVEWGGTRIDLDFVKRAESTRVRNLCYIWQKHGQFLREYWKRGPKE